jgi:hypothetical protein
LVLCSGPPRIVRGRETKKRVTRKIATTRGGKNQAGARKTTTIGAGKVTTRRIREIKKGIRIKTKTRIKFPRIHE